MASAVAGMHACWATVCSPVNSHRDKMKDNVQKQESQDNQDRSGVALVSCAWHSSLAGPIWKMASVPSFLKCIIIFQSSSLSLRLNSTWSDPSMEGELYEDTWKVSNPLQPTCIPHPIKGYLTYKFIRRNIVCVDSPLNMKKIFFYSREVLR